MLSLWLFSLVTVFSSSTVRTVLSPGFTIYFTLYRYPAQNLVPHTSTTSPVSLICTACWFFPLFLFSENFKKCIVIVLLIFTLLRNSNLTWVERNGRRLSGTEKKREKKKKEKKCPISFLLFSWIKNLSFCPYFFSLTSFSFFSFCFFKSNTCISICVLLFSTTIVFLLKKI